ncbi:MAG: hypothetical protein ACI8RD_013037 [Bacillariaceae sp.]|jgi:hypothetical protein
MAIHNAASSNQIPYYYRYITYRLRAITACATTGCIASTTTTTTDTNVTSLELSSSRKIGHPKTALSGIFRAIIISLG